MHGSTVDTSSSVDVLWRCLFLFIAKVVDTANLLCLQTVHMTVEIFQVWLSDQFLTCPLLCSATCTVLGCHGRRRLRRGADAVSYGPDCSEYIEILQLQSIEKVVDVTVGQIQQIPRVLTVRRQPRLHSCTRRIRSWTRSLTCPLCSTKCPWLSVQKLRRSRSWPMSLLCRS